MYAVVRLRSTIKTKPDIKTTLKMLSLTRVNHCTLVQSTPNYMGMLQVVKDYVAYGEVDADTIEELLVHRAELAGGIRLTEEYLKENTPFSSIRELAEKLATDDIMLRDIPSLKPVLRLHPPRKGHSGIKKAYQEGGVLGNHGKSISKLLHRMR
ncbi:MAG: 50S ribosomal protein L30 [Methermicoccaceae archaeon]